MSPNICKVQKFARPTYHTKPKNKRHLSEKAGQPTILPIRTYVQAPQSLPTNSQAKGMASPRIKN